MALVTFTPGQVLTAQQLNDSFAAVGGFVLLVPTSVAVSGGGSSGSVSATGKVTFGTAATLSVNGCFTADYTNYRVIVDFAASAADADVEMRLRVGGSDNSTASSYIFQVVSGSSTSVGAARTTSSAARPGQGAASTATNSLNMEFFRPFVATTTAYNSVHGGSLSGAYYRTTVGTHNQTTSYDGFSILPTTGTITGSLTVYGYGE